jgi:hypothetical protein
MTMHRIEPDAAGNLLHYIADELRATVPAEHAAAYLESCQEAADALAPEPQASAPAKPAKTPPKAPAVKPKGKARKGAR